MIWVPILMLAGALSLPDTSGQDPPQAQNVLLLQSFDRGNQNVDDFTGDFRVDLDRRPGRPVNVVQIVIGPTGSVAASEQAVVEYIQATFASRPKPDLIVTVAGPAATFARKYRQQIFPGTPVLFASVDERFLAEEPLGANEAAVPIKNDFPATVEAILHVLPDTKQVFVVIGKGPVASFWRRQLGLEFGRFRYRLRFIWADDLALPEMLRQCANLPRDSAILYVNMHMDTRGGAFADARVMAELHATANAPLFAAHSAYFGFGIVGGPMMSIPEMSRNAAEAAIRLLDGSPPSTVRVPTQVAGPPVFDWRELERWGIPESRLPSGSVVQFRTPSLWQAYRRTVLTAAVALLVQTSLIVGLLYQRRARQQAESESRKNLALAADASRRQTMSALTSSISHELGQPLSSIMYNAQALDMMMSADRATPETIREILSDIQGQGLRATQIIERHRAMLKTHQLEKKKVDLAGVISETIALVAHDLQARQVEATVNMPSQPCVINGDQVLLQQVFVNLVMNAVDAMVTAPPGSRRVTISARLTAGHVAIAVRDSGTGLPPEIDGRLFAPFVTTKSQGLGIGLTIAQTIVQTHRGTIEAGSNPEGGATFTVTLPVVDAAVTPGIH